MTLVLQRSAPMRWFVNSATGASLPHMTIQLVRKLSSSRSRLDQRTGRYGRMSIFSSTPRHTVEIDICAREQVASKVKDGLSDILEGVRPWYSMLVRVSFEHLPLLAIMLYLAWWFTYGSSIEKPVERSEASPRDTFGPFITNIMVSLGILSILHFLSKALDKVWSWLFPRVCFAIGQGKQRFALYNTVERVRWIIVGLGAASLLGAIL